MSPTRMAQPGRKQAAIEPWQAPDAKPFLRIEAVTKTFGKVLQKYRQLS